MNGIHIYLAIIWSTSTVEKSIVLFEIPYQSAFLALNRQIDNYRFRQIGGYIDRSFVLIYFRQKNNIKQSQPKRALNLHLVFTIKKVKIGLFGIENGVFWCFVADVACIKQHHQKVHFRHQFLNEIVTAPKKCKMSH